MIEDEASVCAAANNVGARVRDHLRRRNHVMQTPEAIACGYAAVGAGHCGKALLQYLE